MKSRCFGCNVEKDTDVLEVSPFADEDGLTSDPIDPLFALECQGAIDVSEFCAVVVCHSCFHKLEPDMWISQAIWESINPVVPYGKLPPFVPNLTDISLLKPLP